MVSYGSTLHFAVDGEGSSYSTTLHCFCLERALAKVDWTENNSLPLLAKYENSLPHIFCFISGPPRSEGFPRSALSCQLEELEANIKLVKLAGEHQLVVASSSVRPDWRLIRKNRTVSMAKL